MTRVQQRPGARGSLKWIQKATAEHWAGLETPILNHVIGVSKIEWRSPQENDGYAEYRDASFLQVLGLDRLSNALANFWPSRGPQWDALGLTDKGHVLIVEAKAHIGELCSPPTSAGPLSRARIVARLDEVAASLGANPTRSPWSEHFYQLANRIAHLAFLRNNDVPAFLVLVNFVNDHEMAGPSSPEAWQAAYQVVRHAMGLPARHPLGRFIIDVYPDVKTK